VSYSGQLSARTGFGIFQGFATAACIATEIAVTEDRRIACGCIAWFALQAFYWAGYSLLREFEREASPTGEKERG